MEEATKELDIMIKESLEDWDDSRVGENSCANALSSGETAGYLQMMRYHKRTLLRSKYVHFLLTHISQYKKGEISEGKLMELINGSGDNLLESHREISVEKNLYKEKHI